MVFRETANSRQPGWQAGLVREGLYESLVTQALQTQLADLTGLEHTTQRVAEADQPHVLARHLQAVLERALQATTSPQQRLALVNRLVGALHRTEAYAPDDRVSDPACQLTALTRPSGPGLLPGSIRRPRTPLSDAALLTNAHGEPNLGAELTAELDSADHVDLLCAFVKWHGLRVLEDQLNELRGRGVPLRVITTTYLGASERQALDRLVRDFGAQVRISYDTKRTRLHAKAWLFRRDSGFSTAYVGSSNLSRAALLDGVEWNVRLSAVATPTLLQKFLATFDTYWNDAGFEPYEPDRDRDRLDDALSEASGASATGRVTISLSGLRVRPYPYQQQMLDEIAAERDVHGQHRNLVVAATGTGKTVVAALDYRRLCGPNPASQPRLLFVAHRKEILTQSLRTYREVLTDHTFGEVYVDGTRPERWRHVFASVQSLTKYGVTNLDPDAFDIVVVDEFHHAAAATYRRLLDHVRPKELLGLTATPERGDGFDIREFFDGRVATELRLWDALGADLLCPFHYFVLADGTDLRRLRWKRGRYDDAELENVYTGNTTRVALILKQLQDKVVDPGSMRALGFCVSVAHAHFMAGRFVDAGIPAGVVSGNTPTREREETLRQLRLGTLNAVFTVDVFNEGVDVPEIDTLLFLRPTESATVFLQQFGRGLRRTEHKPVLTALDFVGHQHTAFRFDRKLRALTGSSRKAVENDVTQGFPFLPAGCQILMDRVAQQHVLENLRGQLGARWPQLVQELRSCDDATLSGFLDQTDLDLSDVLRAGRYSWTRLRRDAGKPTRTGRRLEVALLKRVRALAHVDDEPRATSYHTLLADVAADYEDIHPRMRLFADMLFYSLWPDGGGFACAADGLRALRGEAAVRDELAEVIALSMAQARHLSTVPSGPLLDSPLRVHAHYQREELLAALGYATPRRPPTTMRQGVVHLKDSNMDAFLVTLRKSEADFSPTTMYRDYPISPTLFHWESQSTTTLASPTGRRYLKGTSTVLLFVRETGKNAYGTSPYLFLGPARHVEHAGERPIAITWRLDTPMPSAFFHAASVAAS